MKGSMVDITKALGESTTIRQTHLIQSVEDTTSTETTIVEETKTEEIGAEAGPGHMRDTTSLIRSREGD